MSAAAYRLVKPTEEFEAPTTPASWAANAPPQQVRDVSTIARQIDEIMRRVLEREPDTMSFGGMGPVISGPGVSGIEAAVVRAVEKQNRANEERFSRIEAKLDALLARGGEGRDVINVERADAPPPLPLDVLEKMDEFGLGQYRIETDRLATPPFHLVRVKRAAGVSEEAFKEGLYQTSVYLRDRHPRIFEVLDFYAERHADAV